MNTAFFDYEKAMQALLYVVSELKAPTLHQAFKALYFAEQDYLGNYGNTMLGDTFIKMEAGPVPSRIYHLVQMADGRYNGNWLGTLGIQYAKQNIEVIQGKRLSALVAPDLDYLAGTEKDCLDKAIAFCRNRSFADLKSLSHDAAWDAADMNREMDRLKIAEAGGADESALSYLGESLANNDYCSL
ncbi:Panacea domain-containing protein [Hymenobacter sp. PAMC 26628]|uniref:Panacea domain-containing protein n=1 Tax=Hymenobacter sp. PAMC 26628 TaxID=1484118 RepID=UPI0007705BB1|nr:Panacea domain-containing protein [Hymenobacter sp. PAMC 26628]AMJ67184.1 hypothetical protein AXW84_18435 [Hymenobacter sp. PAMC 26628]